MPVVATCGSAGCASIWLTESPAAGGRSKGYPIALESGYSVSLAPQKLREPHDESAPTLSTRQSVSITINRKDIPVAVPRGSNKW